MSSRIKAFLAVLALCLLSGCTAKENTEASIQIFAMDTIMDLNAYGENANNALLVAEKEINRLDAMLSVINKNSEIFTINQNAGNTPVTVNPEIAGLLQRAKELNTQTNNAFAITIYPFVDAWGFMKPEKRVPSEAEINSLLPLVDDGKLNVDASLSAVKLEEKNMAIDLGGIAKGFLSDRVTSIMNENGVSGGIISLGGNISAIGTKHDGNPWRVALIDPSDQNSKIGTFNASDVSIITSGGYQRFFEEDGHTYHHIIDPNTGYPAQSDLLSVTIISNDGTKADALSTALFVMGLEKAEEFWRQNDDFDAVFITNDKRVKATEGVANSFVFEAEKQGYTFEVIPR